VRRGIVVAQTSVMDRLTALPWLLLCLVGLLISGCASLSQVPSHTALPSPVSARTITAKSTLPPTSTAGLLPTRPVPTATSKEEASSVTITVLYDNNAYDPRLQTAWGFSCLVEGLEKTILFDTGGDSRILLRNMDMLGIEPAVVDTVVISHVHGDHVGGLAGFLAENHSVTVYLPRSFPQSIKRATAEKGAELVEVAGPVEVCSGVHSTGELGRWIREQSLVIETTQGLLVITGCAHPGVVSIVRRAKELRGGEIHLVLGGFHLGGASAGSIASIVEQFQQLGVQRVAPCHCSGDLARRLFGNAYGESFVAAGVGSQLQVPE
jgi:7,8-dihydropterin-6-yl-methyl-4-(beta-D-ribofuranosyl)aminobenzene 5'-phosphate synthase